MTGEQVVDIRDFDITVTDGADAADLPRRRRQAVPRGRGGRCGGRRRSGGADVVHGLRHRLRARGPHRQGGLRRRHRGAARRSATPRRSASWWPTCAATPVMPSAAWPTWSSAVPSTRPRPGRPRRRSLGAELVERVRRIIGEPDTGHPAARPDVGDVALLGDVLGEPARARRRRRAEPNVGSARAYSRPIGAVAADDAVLDVERPAAVDGRGEGGAQAVDDRRGGRPRGGRRACRRSAPGRRRGCGASPRSTARRRWRRPTATGRRGPAPRPRAGEPPSRPAPPGRGAAR